MNNFIRLPAVKKATGLQRSTIYKMMSKNQFPRQIKLGPKSIAWLEADVIQWQQDQISKTNSAIK